MTNERKLQIAMTLVKSVIKKEATFRSLSKRGLEETSKEVGVPAEELSEFFRPVVQEIVDEAFKK